MNTALPFRPARPWQSHPRETATLGLLGCAAALALVGVSGATPTVGEWHVVLQALFYLVAGLVWILPLKPLLRWMETGHFSR